MKPSPMLSVSEYENIVSRSRTLMTIMDEACLSLREQTYHLGNLEGGAGSLYRKAMFDCTAVILNMIKGCRLRVDALSETRILMGDKPSETQESN